MATYLASCDKKKLNYKLSGSQCIKVTQPDIDKPYGRGKETYFISL